jgi:predicted acylesterase/phospholipase RssA/CRP-like cAMP-binding protein
LRGADPSLIDEAGPGATFGEIAALAGTARTATVQALEPSVVRRIGPASMAAWFAEDGERLVRLTALARARIDRHRAIELVAELIHVEPSAAAAVVELADWVHLDAGEVLFHEGEASDAGYLVVSGRLTVNNDGVPVGEIARGELVGELGLIDHRPRSATVVAQRESSLARFDLESFHALTAVHPALMLQLSQTIVTRLGRQHARPDRARSILVAVTAPIDRRGCLMAMSDELARHGTTRHLWAARIDADLGRPGLVEAERPVTVPAISEYIHDAETDHDYLLLEVDRDDGNWTRRALTLADRIVVVMSAHPGAEEVDHAERILAAGPRRAYVERWVALVQPAGVRIPSDTAAIADRLAFDRVAHVHAGVGNDFERLARLVSGNGIGLVLGGGGARGFAHLGVWQALADVGIAPDLICGASIGALLGALMALQIPVDKLVPMVAKEFHGLLDYTVPIVSLIKGERVSRRIAAHLGGLDLRDTWLPFSCVSTNLTRSRVQVHDRGPLATAVRASVAIPGILPPVPFSGDLLVDGGVLNNLPCDVVRGSQMVRQLIAVDLSSPVGPTAEDDYGLSVSGWKALRARTRSGTSRYPGLMAVLMRAMVAGSVRDRDRILADGSVDCYLDLDLPGVQLLDFERVEEIARRGYAAALPRLEAWAGAR